MFSRVATLASAGADQLMSAASVAALTVVVQSVAVMANDRNMLRSVGVDVPRVAEGVRRAGSKHLPAGHLPSGVREGRCARSRQPHR